MMNKAETLKKKPTQVMESTLTLIS
ncbi:hypothetical protein CGLO_07796 [Colletotrichum gloeosporioides Cg-14]|uniref:Uncharacterized protein n=1 Tax=Colletotrichum gloeosporioides (strain Cg-14) TaxID=1237896 RepID=T0LLK0_COLGC|nr:hypothetical protein CGLO_07796 [Colletotrichum gloeosporioides Cg-14]